MNEMCLRKMAAIWRICYYLMSIAVVSAISSESIVDLDDINKQDKKFDENLKKDLLKSLLNFKGELDSTQSSSAATTTTTTTTSSTNSQQQQQQQQQRHNTNTNQYENSNSNNKAYVPRAMLEEYIRLRPLVREIIPDDRDFYGKINIDDLDRPHENIWNAASNRDYDIEIDMGADSGRHRGGQSSRIKADHIAHIGTDGDPQDVPEEIEASLEPRETHSDGVAKKFTSVHLKFNLSQSRVYRETTAVDNLRKAELHLSRERLLENNECQLDHSNCGTARYSIRSRAKFQKIHILQVTGYRDDKVPTTILHETEKVDTDESTPLSIDITSIVKTWLMNPKSNHGLIVRVTNDDKDEENVSRARRQVKLSSDERAIELLNSKTNASLTTASKSLDIPAEEYSSLNQVPEHIRLKRQFRGSSDDSKSWLMNQPSLLIYSIDSTKKHVKRHHNEEDLDQMQADEPLTSSISISNDDEKTTQYPIGPISQATSTTAASITTETSSSKPADSFYARRVQPIARRGPATSRNSAGVSASSGRSGTNQSGQKSKGKSKPSRMVERCSKKSLAINFDEVGWSNWIIAPQAYYANYCSGDCSWPHLDDVQNSTNHAIIQAIFNSVGRVVPKSCCVPVKLTEMAILYQLDGVVQMRVYGDMIVDTCGCL